MKALTWHGKRDVRAAEAYEMFQPERDECVKVVLEP
ncbi:hypothetical protein FXF53_22670 [Micromonospora sp. WP24]|nr:hypothetical protein [Micromonospora sp. WP24]TYB96162.1 hypothetical protein FXF53_22670 [Micromonospora sp. WP24]